LLFLNGELGQISGAIEGADSAPGEQVLHAWAVTQKKADTALGKWNALKSGDLAAVNTSSSKRTYRKSQRKRRRVDAVAGAGGAESSAAKPGS